MKTDKLEMGDILKKCMDSPGYLLFGAFLTNKKDPKGFPIIEFQYRRYHFSLEDSKESIKALKKFVDEEFQKLMSPENNGQE